MLDHGMQVEHFTCISQWATGTHLPLPHGIPVYIELKLGHRAIVSMLNHAWCPGHSCEQLERICRFSMGFQGVNSKFGHRVIIFTLKRSNNNGLIRLTW